MIIAQFFPLSVLLIATYFFVYLYAIRVKFEVQSHYVVQSHFVVLASEHLWLYWRESLAQPVSILVATAI